ncbi:CopG family transcriptional regulator [Porphyrobacter sp. YT40]|nr:CopG family transcriptional regulator [Porphyrobacter sp. YT40]
MSTFNEHKKRGRPPVDSEPVRVRLQRPLLDALDEWCVRQEDAPTRPEAVRRILSSALGVDGT